MQTLPPLEFEPMMSFRAVREWHRSEALHLSRSAHIRRQPDTRQREREIGHFIIQTTGVQITRGVSP
jgi:hypothetical protein